METLYGLAQMEAINHDHDKMHQDFLSHVRRKKKFDYFTLINISNLIETSFWKFLKQNILKVLFITLMDISLDAM